MDIIVRVLVGIFAAPVLSIMLYVYTKHSLYCNTGPEFKTDFIQIDLRLGECKPGKNAMKELGEVMSLMFGDVTSGDDSSFSLEDFRKFSD